MKDNRRKEFLEFLTSNEAPPANLKELTQKDISLTFNRFNIIVKFGLLQMIGALITLSFCPQFGVGISEGHGITHILRMYGDAVCASFCGALFLSAGSLLASFVMDQDELFWIWKRYKFQLIIFPVFLWSALMIFNITWNLDSETVNYHLLWILSAILAQESALFLKAKTYKGILKSIR